MALRPTALVIVALLTACGINRDGTLDVPRDGGDAGGTTEDDAGPGPPADAPGPPADGGPCAAPECTPGTNEDEPAACGSCGLMYRSRICLAACRWSPWGEYGACTESPAPECVPGAVEPREATCGACSNGTRSETRTCNAACAWDAWDTSGPCAGEVYCTYEDRITCPGSGGGGWTCCSNGEWSDSGC